MKLVATACADHLNAQVSAVFEACPYFIFVNTEQVQNFEVIKNPFVHLWSGGDIFCAQFLVNRGTEAVLCCDAGKNAIRIFQEAQMKIFSNFNGSVCAGLQAIENGTLTILNIK